MNRPIPPGQVSVEQSIGIGFELLRAGRLADADALARRLREVAPSVIVSLLSCDVAERRSGPAAALSFVEDALQRYGARGDLLLRRAQLLVPLMRRPEAVIGALDAARASPADVRILQGAAAIVVQHGEPADARPLLQRACELLPDHPGLLHDLALCHFYLNDMDEADRLLGRVLQLAPGHGNAMHVRAQLRTQSVASNHVESLRRALARTDLPTHDRILGGFALAKELEDLGEDEAAFAALDEAARLKRGTLQYDVQDEVEAMRDMIATYDAAALARLPAGCGDAAPIFVVGLPRTGTTLVERILGMDPDTRSIGEAMEFPLKMGQQAEATRVARNVADETLLQASLHMDFAALGRAYLDAVQPMARGRSRTVDKLPFNFLYCGLIHQALPNARIVHLTRDPLDTCYAVYKAYFINLYHFSYRLEEIAEYFVAYRRTMDHWRAVLPGVIHDVSYERLVADPEGESRRLLEFCGLPWHPGVLDFHRSSAASTTASSAQVRQPIYRSSVAKWRRVARQMQPVLARLQTAGIVDADGNPVAP